MNGRRAIARVTLKAERGTGFLVAPDLVITAFHVIGDRRASPPSLLSGSIRLEFGEKMTEATVVDFDAKADWALLRCQRPPEVELLRFNKEVREKAPWNTFGFPDAMPAGMVVAGEIRDEAGVFPEEPGVPVLQLFCEEAAAGSGMPVKGLSGAPVLVNGLVVGLLRWGLLGNNARSVAGMILACPTKSILARHPGLYIPPPQIAIAPTTRRSLSFAEKKKLAHLLLACRTAMGTPAHRDGVVAQLPAAIANSISRDSAANFDVMNVLTTCLGFADGLQHVLGVVQFFEDASLAVQALEDEIRNLRLDP